MSRLPNNRPRRDDADFARLVQEAKSRKSLSDIVGRHTTLKRRGARELVGLCPFHEERTPSFEVNDSKGTYYCHGCRAAGDHIRFLMLKDGMSFMEALTALDSDLFPEVTDEERAKRRAEDEAATAARIAEVREVWSASVRPENTPAAVYARSRGITMPLPPTVRFVMTPSWRDLETGEVGPNRPAMLCALQNAAGEIVGCQRIFLRDDGTDKRWLKPKKSKLSLGVLVGSALRLGPVAEEIIICEGPEDGLSLAQELPGRSVWVACGTALMSRLELPSEVRSIVLAGDNNEAGRRAVAECAEGYQARGFATRAMFPEPAFKDWNDQLRGIRA